MNRAGDGMASPSRLHREGRLCLHTTSQSASQTAPLVGEPLAKPFTLRGLPKPPLGRGGGSASALTERLSPAAAHGQASFRTTSQSASQTVPLVGEPLAKRQSFTKCQGLPSVGATAVNATSPQRTAQYKQKRRRRFKSRQRRFAYSVNSGQWIRPWPRCCARPSCRRRKSGTRCSGPERSAGQPG